MVAENNILYSLNTGVKNVLPYRTIPHTPSDTGITVSLDTDNIYKITGTKTTNDSYVELDDVDSSELVGDHVASISVSGTGDFQIAAYGHNGSTWTLMLTTSTSQGFSVGSYTKIKFRIRFTGSLNSSYNATVKPMVCVMGAWGQSHDWQPPALPNNELTQLEAEDREALAEEIDSGAKNKFIPRSQTQGGITATVNSDNSLDVTWSAIGSSNAYCRINDDTLKLPVGNYVFSGITESGNLNYYLHLEDSSGAIIGNASYASPNLEFKVTDATKNYKVYVGILANSAAQSTAKKIYPMICTKAAFGVSSKFVPYRPNWDLVGNTVKSVNDTFKRLDYGSNNVTTISVNVSTWQEGTYLVACNNATSNTSIKGTSVYMFTLRHSLNFLLFTKIAEMSTSENSNSNITNMSINNDTITISYEHTGYHTVYAVKL